MHFVPPSLILSLGVVRGLECSFISLHWRCLVSAGRNSVCDTAENRCYYSRSVDPSRAIRERGEAPHPPPLAQDFSVFAERPSRATRRPLGFSFGTPPKSSPFHPLALSSAVEEEGSGDENAAAVDDVPPSSPESTQSKRRAQRKVYAMTSDVERLVASRDPSAPAKAEELISRLRSLRSSTGCDAYEPTAKAYTLWIDAHAKSGRPDAALLAERVLNDMKELGESTGGEDLKPNVASYTAVIDAYARSNSASAPEDAERILFSMLDANDESAMPNAVTCDAVLNAWSRRRSVPAAERATILLERMDRLRRQGHRRVRPTSYSYSTVVTAWARSGGGTVAAERAERLLDAMIDAHGTAVREGDAEYAEDAKPNVVAFNAVMDAWARSGDPGSGRRAELILERMEGLSGTEGLEDLTPDAISFNTVINAWAKSGHVNAAREAERVLGSMERLSADADDVDESGKTPPRANTVTYNAVLNAWAKSPLPDAPPRAERILTFMIESYRNDVETSRKPDAVSFGSVLNAWAKSREAGKARRAKSTLDSMVELYGETDDEAFKPNLIGCNTVLNACAFSAATEDDRGRQEALKVAVSTFAEMKRYEIDPDAVTYGNLIKSFANLMSPGERRTEMSSQLFRKCAEDGMVSDMVLNEMRRAVPSNDMGRLLERGGGRGRDRRGVKVAAVTARDLPADWTRNVAVGRGRYKGGGANKPKAKRGKMPSAVRKKKTEEKKVVDTFREGASSVQQPIRRTTSITEPSWDSSRNL